jgi:predicted phosphodiesterase
MRVFAVSDIHIDYQENKNWLLDLSTTDYREDILILAGDVSDKLELLEQCFRSLTIKFLKVLFVPGNHELWVSRDGISSSIKKYQHIRELADACDVSMQPLHYGTLSIVPLLSWYDFSFGAPGAKLLDTWIDFRACIWPDQLQPQDVTKYFLEKNERHLAVTNNTVISFSHFLPRIDLMPSYIPQAYHYLYPVLGSELLENQIRALKPDIHIYGHSHVNRYLTMDGIQYINNAFGYPSEDRIAKKQLLCVYEDE